MTRPRAMRAVLLLAAAYNLAWGALVFLFPLAPFRWAGIDPPRYPSIVQCLGMVVGVYGVAYAVAARDPLRHWPVVLAGLLGKVLGPIGFVAVAARGELPWRAGWTIVTNDLVWWAPFAWILARAWRARSGLEPPPPCDRADGAAANRGLRHRRRRSSRGARRGGAVGG